MAVTAKTFEYAVEVDRGGRMTIPGGGHFLQEDCGEQLARVVVSWISGK